jgi:RNA polymerase sigma-70 factor (ECF subfamily)
MKEVRSQKSEVRKQNGYAVIIDRSEQDCMENIVRTETLRQLYDAIHQLPAQCKKVFTKLYIEGKSVAETAEEMKITISTVKNQKARGIKILTSNLKSKI